MTLPSFEPPSDDPFAAPSEPTAPLEPAPPAQPAAPAASQYPEYPEYRSFNSGYWSQQQPQAGTVPGQPPAGAPMPGAPMPGQPVFGQPVFGQPVFGQPVPGAVPPARRSRGLLGVAGAAALIVAFGAGLAIGRVTAPKSTTASTGSQASTPPATSAPVGAPGTLPSADVVNALLPLPSGATALKASGANADGSMSLAQYVKLLYPSSTTETSLLQARGFEGAATRWMNTAAGQEDCFYLIVFSGQDGAQSYALGLVKAHEDASANAADTQFPVSVMTDGVGFETSTLDAYGNADSWVYGEVGNVAIIVHSFTPAKLDRTQMLGLLDQQVSRLTADESGH
ncbi:hypothetical protein KDL01_16420 [Actinospica durhamensis]|uniref:Uncharacterized protein n=1 Tax=Actinospica durhamensis TaxID=1508375 RepID=A0A941EVT9_9ACTN|nr:hypothetical protein [Actinospica durhamensis]MBR7834859.1 hypothetical protein [Actinospica durhamensis]